MAMKQEKVKNSSGQFNYLGRWVDKEHFRAFVYGLNDQKKLANSYDEYEKLISSGIWFDSIESVKKIESNQQKNVEDELKTEKNTNLIEDFAEKSQNPKKQSKSYKNVG